MSEVPPRATAGTTVVEYSLDGQDTQSPTTPHSLSASTPHGGGNDDGRPYMSTLTAEPVQQLRDGTPGAWVTAGRETEDEADGEVMKAEKTTIGTTHAKDPASEVYTGITDYQRESGIVTVVHPSVLPPSPPLTRVPSTESVLPVEQSDAPEPSHVPDATDATRVDEVARPSNVVRPHWLASDEGLPDASDALKNSDMSPTVSHPLEVYRAAQRSPPVWEVIEPPPDNNSARTGQYVDGAANGGATQRSLAPKSSYYFGPPPVDSAYGTHPVGQMGVHHPREVLRVERDWSVGDIPQFTSAYPLELESRLTPTEYLDTVNTINEVLISAYDLKHSALENTLAVCTLYLSRLFTTTHYEKEMLRLHAVIDDLNSRVYNPVGLNILWPRNTAFMFLEIEYY